MLVYLSDERITLQTHRCEFTCQMKESHYRHTDVSLPVRWKHHGYRHTDVSLPVRWKNHTTDTQMWVYLSDERITLQTHRCEFTCQVRCSHYRHTDVSLPVRWDVHTTDTQMRVYLSGEMFTLQTHRCEFTCQVRCSHYRHTDASLPVRWDVHTTDTQMPVYLSGEMFTLKVTVKETVDFSRRTLTAAGESHTTSMLSYVQFSGTHSPSRASSSFMIFMNLSCRLCRNSRLHSGPLKLASPPRKQSAGGNRAEGRKEGNILFNDTFNTFYLLLYLPQT